MASPFRAASTAPTGLTRGLWTSTQVSAASRPARTQLFRLRSLLLNATETGEDGNMGCSTPERLEDRTLVTWHSCREMGGALGRLLTAAWDPDQSLQAPSLVPSDISSAVQVLT